MDLTSLLFTIFSNAPINVRSWSKRTDPARCVENVYVGMRRASAILAGMSWIAMIPSKITTTTKTKQSESKVNQEGIAHHLSQSIENGNFASGPGTSIEKGQKDCESFVRYWGHSVKRDSPIYRREIVIPLKLKDASKPTCRPCSRRTTPFEF